MTRIVLSTSSSGLDYLEKPDNVRIIPLHVIIDGKDYLDGKDITYDEMTEQMVKNEDFLPETAPASVEELLSVFKKLYSEGIKEVIVLTLSSLMSDTYDNVREAKKLFSSNMAIHLFDTKTIAYLEALQVLEVSKMVTDGDNILKIKERLDILRENLSFWVVIEDLRNLIKTKRLSVPKGFIANLFDVKPILGIDKHGQVHQIDHVRNIDRALKAMCDNVIETLEDKPGQVFIITTSYDKYLKPLKKMLAENDIVDVPVVPAASVSIAIHGPYSIGIGVLHDC